LTNQLGGENRLPHLVPSSSRRVLQVKQVTTE
jgi:hypothetical protein